jgi:hypothetical protein
MWSPGAVPSTVHALTARSDQWPLCNSVALLMSSTSGPFSDVCAAAITILLLTRVIEVYRAAASGGARGDGSGKRQKRKKVYSEHLAFSALHAGVKAGHLLQGTLRVNRYNPFEGFVSQPASGQVCCMHLSFKKINVCLNIYHRLTSVSISAMTAHATACSQQDAWS